MKICIFLFSFLLLSANNIKEITSDINKNQARLNETLKQKDQINSKLNTIATSINKKLLQLKQIDSQIKNLNDNIKINKNQNKNQNDKLDSLRQKIIDLDNNSKDISLQLSNVMLQYITYSNALDSIKEVSSMHDVVLKYTFEAVKKDLTNKIQKLQNQQSNIANDINNTTNSISKINTLIQTQEDKQKTLLALKNEQNNILTNMKNDLDSYNDQLKQIDKERKSLDSLLAKLNILKKTKQEEERQRKEKERLAKLQKEKELREKQARAQKEMQEKKRLAKLEEDKRKAAIEAKKIAKTNPNKAKEILRKADENLKKEKDTQNSKKDNDTTIDAPLDVKQVASSYQETQTIKYTGKKTIAPLKKYTLEQRYGPYFDPVYKLKVFNESVILKSKEKDAVVYSIMDGKVVYAKEMPMLKKVVIIEHANAIYSIYSQLDKISPLIKQGGRIKKGTIIGRVNELLHFEVTQNDKHLDPMQIISPSS